MIGRVDYARVQLIDDAIQPLAISGASMLSSTTRADGFVIVPQDSEGYAEGTEVELFLYDLVHTELLCMGAFIGRTRYGNRDKQQVREDDFASSIQIGIAQLPRSALKAFATINHEGH